MTTKTDAEQLRAAHGVPEMEDFPPLPCPQMPGDDYTERDYQMYLLGRQSAMQSQDADRLDWLQQNDGRFFKLLHITSIVGRGFSPVNSNGKWFPSLRDAIDHARRAEGEEE